MNTPYFRMLAALIVPMLLTVTSLNAEGAGEHLFILSGQSNMARLNPAVSFTPAVQ